MNAAAVYQVVFDEDERSAFNKTETLLSVSELCSRSLGTVLLKGSTAEIWIYSVK